MTHRSTQLAARKNPGSPRVHGLRLKVESFSMQPQGAVENLGGNETSSRVAPVIERRSEPSLIHLREERTEVRDDRMARSVVNAENGIERPIPCKQASQVLGVHPRTI